MRSNQASPLAVFAGHITRIASPVIWLALTAIGRLHLPLWWFLPSAVIAFGLGLITARAVTLERQFDDRVSVVHRSLWGGRTLGEFPLRSWMSSRLQHSVLIVEGQGKVVASLHAVTIGRARCAKQQLDTFLIAASTGSLDEYRESVLVDARDARESTLRACVWCVSAWIAAGWHPVALLVSLFFAAYPVLFTVRLLAERAFKMRTVPNPRGEHRRRRQRL